MSSRTITLIRLDDHIGVSWLQLYSIDVACPYPFQKFLPGFFQEAAYPFRRGIVLHRSELCVRLRRIRHGHSENGDGRSALRLRLSGCKGQDRSLRGVCDGGLQSVKYRFPWMSGKTKGSAYFRTCGAFHRFGIFSHLLCPVHTACVRFRMQREPRRANLPPWGGQRQLVRIRAPKARAMPRTQRGVIFSPKHTADMTMDRISAPPCMRGYSCEAGR